MAWYRAGTVAITAGQNTVTGTGTSFSANARVGDAFLGPDGAWYEVTNIASATVLSILPAYKGATVGAGSYAISPIQGYDKSLRDAINAIVQQWGATLAGLGAVSTEDVVPVAKGGTGGTTPSAARSGIGALGAGDYGLGGSSGYPSANTPLDSLLANSLFSATDSNPPDWQANGGRGQYPMGLSFYRSAIVRSQLAISYGTLAAGGGVYWRGGNGTAGAFNNWLRLLNEGEQSIGIGQAWTNVLSQRALNTTYTNTTGRPIQLAVQAGVASSANTGLAVVVNGINTYTAYAAAANAYIGCANVIIPPGASYRVNVTNGTVTGLTAWAELT